MTADHADATAVGSSRSRVIGTAPRPTLERAQGHADAQTEIDPELIDRFDRSMRENVSSGSVPLRKAYLESLIQVVDIDDNQIGSR